VVGVVGEGRRKTYYFLNLATAMRSLGIDANSRSHELGTLGTWSHSSTTLGIKSSTSLCLIDALSPHGKAERNHIHKIRVLTAIKVDTLLLRLSLSFKCCG
jgi:hypothetical protein